MFSATLVALYFTPVTRSQFRTSVASRRASLFLNEGSSAVQNIKKLSEPSWLPNYVLLTVRIETSLKLVQPVTPHPGL